MKYYFLAFKRIFEFKGESNIKEFWYFFLINIVITLLLIYVSKKLFDTELISNIYRYISLFTLLSLGFRRLRDAGQLPWLFLIPVVNLFLSGLPKKEA